ncbi:hypothetical protein GPECTOR_43g918 [Gonium pectorale]|uniref:Glycosyl hydrolases family 38 C-terminal domain-containing protein n=1 Tax=Gonium pectorale TaxID=33097 RepID=A0A150G9G8_GONPE|nr:hypothetical protein GPECTOR_43g918 [Gonium pectorale]|eukprot:KXZ46482.1 hypothetical protein GPECTOR_43g918 [Gonium pectorale]
MAPGQRAFQEGRARGLVSSALPNPLLPGGGPPCPPAPLAAPPLILDTIKLPEPPLQPASGSRSSGLSPHYPASSPSGQACSPHTHPNPPSTANSPANAGAASSSPHSFAAAMSAAAAAAVAAATSSATAGPDPSPPPALVLRLYEPHGARGLARLSWPAWLRVGRVAACNLLEEEEGEGQEGKGQNGGGELRVQAGTAGGSVDVPYGPYKVITLKLYLQPPPQQ